MDYVQAGSRVVEREGMFLHDSSICVKYDVRNVPLKPVVTEDEYPDLFRVLVRKADSLASFYPRELVKLNVGSNRGLIQVMRDHMEEVMSARPRRYGIILAYVDIFKRICKVRSHLSICFMYIFIEPPKLIVSSYPNMYTRAFSTKLLFFMHAI